MHVVGHGALGQDHHVDDVDLVEGGLDEQSIDEIEVDRFGRYEVEEPERFPVAPLHRLLPGPEVARP